MKMAASLLLAILMAYSSFGQAEPIPVKPSPEPKEHLCGAILLIGATAAGLFLVIWAMNSNKDCCVGPARLVLEMDQYNGIWVPIATNDIPLVCTTNKFDVFRGQMSGDGARYRIKVTPLPKT